MLVGILALALVLPCRAEQSRKDWLEARIPEARAELERQTASLWRSRAELGMKEGRGQLDLNEALLEELVRRGLKRDRLPSWRERLKSVRDAEPKLDQSRPPEREEALLATRWMWAVEDLSVEILKALPERLRRRLMKVEPIKGLGEKLAADHRAHVARYGADDDIRMAIDMAKYALDELQSEYRTFRQRPSD